MAREYTLRVRCFYDGEYSAEALREEFRKVEACLEDIQDMLAKMTSPEADLLGAKDKP